MTKNALVQWILAQMDQRGWSQADLARASGLSPSLISQIITDHRAHLVRPPAEATIQGLSGAFGVSRIQVMRVVGEALGVPTNPVPVADPTLLSDSQLMRELERRLTAPRRGRPSTMVSAGEDYFASETSA
ncbi:MAG: helix-turn-helix transcriptional regulator [Bowdeniella nasicola]|nr:helix-turn-helix transcriptional regulator [Bowdeniella nasicola]